MYKIYCDGEVIHDPNFDDPERLVYGATLTQQANMADSFSFTIYPSNPGAAGIHKLTSVIEVYQDNELLFRGRPIRSTEGWENQQTVICEGGLAIFNDTILRPYSYKGSVRGYLQMLVTQHNEQVPDEKRFLLRTVTVTDPNDNIVRSNSDYVPTMKEIQEKLINNLGGYLVVSYSNGWILDYLAISSEATGQTITLAKNLLDIIREQNAQDIATALIPLGAENEETKERVTIKSVNDGKDYIIDQEAASRYGLIFATEIWDDVTIPANLLTKAQAKLSDYATLVPTIELTAVDLSLTDKSIDPIRILDNVTVEDDQHRASGRYLVTQRTYNLSDPSADAVTFGGSLPTISGSASKAVSEIQEIPQRILKNESERVRALLNSATGGCVYFKYNDDGVLEEIDILNTDSPDTATKIWRWNINGWGYSNDGGQTYTVAATMDGTIMANMIKAGILASDNGKYSLNMETGVVNMASANITGGTIYIDTDNQALDYIRLNHLKSVAYMASNMFVVENKATADNPYLKAVLQGGGLFFSDTDADKALASLTTTSNWGILSLFNLTDSEEGRLTSGSLRFIDGSGVLRTLYNLSALKFYSDSGTELSSLTPTALYVRKQNGDRIAGIGATSGGIGSLYLSEGDANRVILNDGGLYFYDSSGNLTGKCNPTFRIQTGVGNSGQVSANSYKDYTVQFSTEFDALPEVIPMLYSTFSNSQPAHINMVAYDISTTGFTLRVYNGNSSAMSVPFKWIAITN